MKQLVLTCVALLFVVAGCRSHDPRIARVISTITEQSVRRHVDSLVAIGPRDAYDPAATTRAISYLRAQLVAYGYDPVEEVFESGRGTMTNIIAELWGTTHPERVIEIGAHYDTVSKSPGADDNASGVSGVLEVARALAHTRTDKTIRFCFFAGEECGLLGSRAHVARVKEREEVVEGIVVLEMIGFSTSEPNSQHTPIRIPLLVWPPRTGDFILVISDFSSGGIANKYESAADAYVSDLAYYGLDRLGGFLKDASRSDHSPYWRAGLKGVMITDTANFRNPHYHKASDTPAQVDFGFMRAVTQAAAATMLRWGGAQWGGQPAPERAAAQ